MVAATLVHVMWDLVAVVTTYVSKMLPAPTRALQPVPFAAWFVAKFVVHAMKDKSVKQERVLPTLLVQALVLRANVILPMVVYVPLILVEAMPLNDPEGTPAIVTL